MFRSTQLLIFSNAQVIKNEEMSASLMTVAENVSESAKGSESPNGGECDRSYWNIRRLSSTAGIFRGDNNRTRWLIETVMLLLRFFYKDKATAPFL